ncbi:MAG: sulfate respiration complex hexadecaheme cytochrome HmcA [Pseudomonadota bacterium]
MMKGTSRLRIRTLLLVAVAGVLLYAGAQGIAAISDNAAPPRPDTIRIESMAVFGKLERPAVVFFHDKHSEAAKKMGKDCAACHMTADEKGAKLSLKYMRLEDTGRDAVMNAYHDNCIACHKEASAKKLEAGPVACNDCHDDKRAGTSSRRPVGLDLSLHYRHDKAMANKCETCHHAYNETTEKLYYDKGKEGSCRYCHGETSVKKRISFRLAAHTDCISCHRQKAAEKKVAGPVECKGCHGAEEQALWEKVKDPAPPKRGQPEATIVMAGKGARMGLVPFNHSAHQRASDTCRVCHHKEIVACNECHSVDGKKEGQFITLEKAMHEVTQDASCMGCHDRKKTQSLQCVGCHGAMEKRKISQDACLSCHDIPPGIVAEDAGKNERTAIAVIALMTRPPAADAIAAKDIPEVVEIATLADKYEPAKMPHRRVVDKMRAGIGDNRLAAYFHQTPGTICQGCHHNSPAAVKPPKCASCHSRGKGLEVSDIEKPGLMGAYHQQCMGCHDAMGIEKPSKNDCIGCHLERKQW